MGKAGAGKDYLLQELLKTNNYNEIKIFRRIYMDLNILFNMHAPNSAWVFPPVPWQTPW